MSPKEWIETRVNERFARSKFRLSRDLLRISIILEYLEYLYQEGVIPSVVYRPLPPREDSSPWG